MNRESKSSIIIQLGDREISFTPEEAKKVYQELGILFGEQQQMQKEYVWYPMPIPYNPLPQDYNPYVAPYWIITSTTNCF